MTTLYFMDAKPKLEDGVHTSHVRCVCPDRANLEAHVKDGQIVWAGCPVCQRDAVVEVDHNGRIGFFPMGVVVI